MGQPRPPFVNFYGKAFTNNDRSRKQLNEYFWSRVLCSSAGSTHSRRDALIGKRHCWWLFNWGNNWRRPKLSVLELRVGNIHHMSLSNSILSSLSLECGSPGVSCSYLVGSTIQRVVVVKLTKASHNLKASLLLTSFILFRCPRGCTRPSSRSSPSGRTRPGPTMATKPSLATCSGTHFSRQVHLLVHIALAY